MPVTNCPRPSRNARSGGTDAYFPAGGMKAPRPGESAPRETGFDDEGTHRPQVVVIVASALRAGTAMFVISQERGRKERVGRQLERQFRRAQVENWTRSTIAASKFRSRSCEGLKAGTGGPLPP